MIKTAFMPSKRVLCIECKSARFFFKDLKKRRSAKRCPLCVLILRSIKTGVKYTLYFILLSFLRSIMILPQSAIKFFIPKYFVVIHVPSNRSFV